MKDETKQVSLADHVGLVDWNLDKAQRGGSWWGPDDDQTRTATDDVGSDRSKRQRRPVCSLRILEKGTARLVVTERPRLFRDSYNWIVSFRLESACFHLVSRGCLISDLNIACVCQGRSPWCNVFCLHLCRLEVVSILV